MELVDEPREKVRYRVRDLARRVVVQRFVNNLDFMKASTPISVR
jgi:hypothetical protein